MMVPAKVLFLLLAAFSQQVGVKPPNPPATKGDRVSIGTWFERYPRLWAGLSSNSVMTYILVECIVILSPTGSPILSTLCPLSQPISLAYMSMLTPSFLIAVGLIFSGAAIRFWCYKALGSFFTFEISIKQDHKLITSGPYAYVRHPSYTGAVLWSIGTAVMMCSPNSYIHQCHVMSSFARYLFVALLLLQVFQAVSLLRRGKPEDEFLKKTFGQNWVRYSHAVPYKFIPGIV